MMGALKMSKTIQVNYGSNYIGYNNDGYFYVDKDGFEGAVAFSKAPIIRFQPVTIKEDGLIQVYVNGRIIAEIPYKLNEVQLINKWNEERLRNLPQPEQKEEDTFERNGLIVRNSAYIQAKIFDQSILSVRDCINANEVIEILLRGAYKEYLVVTEKTLYIVKKGFMTGHLAGSGVFLVPLTQITNVSVDYHLTTGYFTVSTGGVENVRKNFWSTDPNVDPGKSPNTISIAGKNLFDAFSQACKIINERLIPNAKNVIEQKVVVTNANESTSNKSVLDELRDLKELLDDGIITKEEFITLKKKIIESR